MDSTAPGVAGSLRTGDDGPAGESAAGTVERPSGAKPGSQGGNYRPRTKRGQAQKCRAMEAYGARLAELRRGTGRSQATVAGAVGVPRNTYCRWEQGLRYPASDYLRQLAAALNCDLADVVP